MAGKRKPENIRVSTWAGRPNYQCVRCPFASLDREAVVLHIIDKHAVKEASK